MGYAPSVDPNWKPPSVKMGQADGHENITLLQANIPSHGHAMNATRANADSRIPTNQLFATSTNRNTPANLYGPSTGAPVLMNSKSLIPVGAGQPHPNMQPYNTISFCIALAGIFPSRT